VSFVIAVAGKGGTGKTTISALLARQLARRGEGPVLAVDADPNDNLADALGMPSSGSIATVTDEFFADKLTIPAGMTREAYLELKLNMVLGEGRDLDLLVMGHPERAGCYCYVNNVLRSLLEGLAKSYAHVVIDNGAGLEHLSRKTAGKIDLLLVVADCSLKAIRAAGRIAALAAELQLAVSEMGLVVNRQPTGLGASESPRPEDITASKLRLLAVIPESEAVLRGDIAGRPVSALPDGDPAVAAAAVLAGEILGMVKRR